MRNAADIVVYFIDLNCQISSVIQMSVVFMSMTARTSSEEQLGIILCISVMLHLSDYSIFLLWKVRPCQKRTFS